MSQKYPLGRWSGRPFLKKSSYQSDFEKCRANHQLIDIKPTRIFSAFITIVIYTHIYLKYIPYYYQDIWTKKWHTIHKKKSPPTTDHQNVKLQSIFQKISARKTGVLLVFGPEPRSGFRSHFRMFHRKFKSREAAPGRFWTHFRSRFLYFRSRF